MELHGALHYLRAEKTSIVLRALNMDIHKADLSAEHGGGPIMGQQQVMGEEDLSQGIS